ncbi:MAG: flagellar biosynthetic protein FliO [Alphaproteobacteria bacterium]|nr:flagellar biosynthetic protein FliO [Alphaproteobacteria bacterium]MBV9694042.1 flagellar biosynthetic protein FliO [Alphaproteobacteria bacterium]
MIAVSVLFMTGVAVAAQAQTLGTGADAQISTWRVVLSFLLCVMVAIGAAVFMRARMGGGLASISPSFGRARRLKVVEMVRLSPTAGLAIVCCDGREMLVLVAGSETKIVADLASAASAASSAPRQSSHA